MLAEDLPVPPVWLGRLDLLRLEGHLKEIIRLHPNLAGAVFAT